MSTRYKLDKAGLRLSLKSWLHFSSEERHVLCHLSVRSQGEVECYQEYLAYLLKRLKEKFEPLDPREEQLERTQWESLTRVPEAVYLKALTYNVLLTPTDWIRMDDLERYSLYRLSKEKYGEDRFTRALEEFLGIPIIKPAKAAGAS
jgi:hypothetical protein